MKKLLIAFAITIVGLGVAMATAPKAGALSGSDFNPGRIIDDSVFFNKDAMSVNEIQNFIFSKSGTCDTNRASADSRFSPPWTCLYQYRENTDTKVNNIGSPNTNPAGSKSAAQIIYDAAQEFSISPRVLLVLLQKEQSLVSDNWPYPSQYRSATGYGCPDTAACDANYYGFYNQVRAAARQFRLYANNPNSYNFKAGRNNNIGYNPNAGCGFQTVYIQNQATAGLYNYTPYVPNAAALNNLYGLGDGCSAYGNRNFWRLWNDWFGSTLGVPYQWAFVSQSADKDLNNIIPGQEINVTVVAKNIGSQAWVNSGQNQINVVTDRPLGRLSQFQSDSWLNQNTPARLMESTVPPGENGTFTFKLAVPSSLAAGSYNEYFSLVAQNVTYFNDIGQFFRITVKPAYTWSFSSQAAYTDSTKSTLVDLSSMAPGQTAWLSIRANNTGNMTWTNTGTNRVSLVTDRPFARLSQFATSAWLGANTPVNLLESTIAPGQTGTFEFPIKAPTTTGVYREYFNPIVQNLLQMNNDIGQFFQINVNQTYRWSFAGQSSFTNSSKTTPLSLNGLSAGQSGWLVVRATNTGNTTWSNSGANRISLVTDRAFARNSRFATGAWLGANTPVNLVESSVAPGQTGTFEFPFTVPAGAGTYREYFNPIVQNYAQMNNDIGQFFQFTVN